MIRKSILALLVAAALLLAPLYDCMASSSAPAEPMPCCAPAGHDCDTGAQLQQCCDDHRHDQPQPATGASLKPPSLAGSAKLLADQLPLNHLLAQSVAFRSFRRLLLAHLAPDPTYILHASLLI